MAEEKTRSSINHRQYTGPEERAEGVNQTVDNDSRPMLEAATPQTEFPHVVRAQTTKIESQPEKSSQLRSAMYQKETPPDTADQKKKDMQESQTQQKMEGRHWTELFNEQEAANDYLRRQCQYWHDRHLEVQQAFDNQKQEVSRLLSELNHQSQTIQRANMKIEELQTHVDQQEATVTRAQNAAMNVLSQTLSAALPDDHIRRKFTELFERVAEWARENAIEDSSKLQEVHNIRQWQELGILRQVTPPNADLNLNFDLNEETAADTLLNTILANSLCEKFLCDPFFFTRYSGHITTRGAEDKGRIDIRGVLRHVLKTVMTSCKGKEGDAHAWRAETVQILANTPAVQNTIEKTYQHIAERSILPHVIDLVRPDLERQAGKELMQIVQDFGNFAVQLWFQKYNIQVLPLRCFERQVYSHDRRDMEIARAVGVEEGDASLDRRPIPIVVQPLIRGSGTLEGKDYEKHRVWSKAVVWVSRNNISRDSEAAVSTRASRLGWFFRN